MRQAARTAAAQRQPDAIRSNTALTPPGQAEGRYTRRTQFEKLST
jgi:hypothetical protein